MSIFGDAWRWAKGAASDAVDAVTGAADPKARYKADPGAFRLGGRDDFADEEGGYLRGTAEDAQGRGGPQIDDRFTNVDRNAAYVARGAQQDATSLMRDMAYGRGPSAAQAQMSRGIDDAISAQYALAASTRGSPYAAQAAQRQAAYQGANMMQRGVQDAAVLRAQEQAQGMQGYLQGATQQRAYDLQQQGLDAQTAYQQAQLEAQQRQANDARSLGYDQLRQQVYGDDLRGRIAGEQIKSGVMQGDADRRQGLFNTFLGMGSSAAGGAAAMGGGKSDARVKTDILPEGFGLLMSDIMGKSEIMSSYSGPSAGGAMGPGAATGPAQGGMFSISPQGVGPVWGIGSDERTKAKAEAEGMKQGIMAALGAQGPSTSPETSTVRQFQESLVPYSYEYKNPSDAPNGQPGRHLGVMAQNVEQVPGIGRQIVQETPGGKALHGPELLSANTAAIGDLHQRLKALEAGKMTPDDTRYMQAFPMAAQKGGY